MSTLPETWTAFYAAKAADPTSKATKRLKDKIVLENMGLVKSIAIKIARATKAGYEDADDMIQAGVIGLMHAVERYDLSKGWQFSTYAQHWIRKEFYRTREGAEAIKRRPENRMPLGVLAKIVKYRLAYGCEPSASDLGDHKGEPITDAQLAKWTQYADLVSLDHTTKAAQESLDGISDGEGHKAEVIGLLLADPAPSALDELEAAELEAELLTEIEDVLTPSERHAVVGTIFEGKTESELGRERGVKKNAINNCARRGLQKLRDGRTMRPVKS